MSDPSVPEERERPHVGHGSEVRPVLGADDGPGSVLRLLALELASLAQTGAAFAADSYAVRRYARLRQMAGQILATLADADPEELLATLERASDGYATPKVDVRGALFDECDRVLLVREVSDGRWTLPGGWADVLDTPTAAVEREFAEEGGLAVRAVRLGGVWDGMVSNGHRSGGPPFHIWKLFYLCEQVDATDRPEAGRDGETSAVGYFALDDLPELSGRRTSVEQLHALHYRHADPTAPPYSD